MTHVNFEDVRRWANQNMAMLVRAYTGVELRRGRARCPLHGGKDDRNFSVHEHGYTCHSTCGSGDAVEFVRRLKYDALPKREGRVAALRELAARMGGAAGVSSVKHGVGRQQPARVDAPDTVDLALAALRADGMVPSMPPTVYAAVLDVLTLDNVGASYLQGRGCDPDAARMYGFRSLSTAGAWGALLRTLRESFLPVELINAGLGKRENNPGFSLSLPWGSRRPSALVIPYCAGGGVVGLRFRNLEAGAGHGDRYRDLGGVRIPAPFNADALDVRGDLFACEGELNAYALHVCGVRAVGMPGAGRLPAVELIREGLQSGERVLAWYDEDRAGEHGAARLAEQVPGVEVITASDDAAGLLARGELPGFLADILGRRVAA